MERRGDAAWPLDGTVALNDNLNLDVRNGRICYIEVLDEPSIRVKVRAVFGRELV